MTTIFGDLHFLLSAHSTDVRAIYDRAASRYEHFRKIWLKLAGEKTEEALLRALVRVLRPGALVLDAGSGTGALSRQIRRLEPSVRLVSLDQSLPMLRQGGKPRATRVQGDVLDLPFPGGTFDVVASDWVLETIPDRGKALVEYLRVLAPGGWLLYTFCSRPDARRWRSAPLRAAVQWGFAGRFLAESEIPLPEGQHFRIRRFHGGLSSLVVAQKRPARAEPARAVTRVATPGRHLRYSERGAKSGAGKRRWRLAFSNAAVPPEGIWRTKEILEPTRILRRMIGNKHLKAVAETRISRFGMSSPDGDPTCNRGGQP